MVEKNIQIPLLFIQVTVAFNTLIVIFRAKPKFFANVKGLKQFLRVSMVLVLLLSISFQSAYGQAAPEYATLVQVTQYFSCGIALWSYFRAIDAVGENSVSNLPSNLPFFFSASSVITNCLTIALSGGKVAYPFWEKAACVGNIISTGSSVIDFLSSQSPPSEASETEAALAGAGTSTTLYGCLAVLRSK